MTTNQTIPLCSYCGNRCGDQEHHLLRRSERPDLIDDPKNKVRLCDSCHRRTEEDQSFYLALQQIFYYWRPGNIELFLRAEAAIEALNAGKEIEYLTPAMTDNYLTMATAKYGFISEQMADLEKNWFMFCSQIRKAMNDKGEKVTEAILETEWSITENGRLMIDYKYKLKALEKLQSTLKARLERFRTERFNIR